jgi:hypothetical protein
MPTNLTGSKIKDTYSQLLHVDGGPAASEKVVYSGTGVATALSVGIGSASVDNLKFDGNTISSTNTNGDINITPNGTGAVVIPTATFTTLNATTFSTTAAAAHIDLTGATFTADGTDTNISITLVPKGTGKIVADGVGINGGVISTTTTNQNLTLSPNGTGEIVATSPFGYGGSGTGGTVTQATSRTTGVTLNKLSGQITLFASTALSGHASNEFTLTNSFIDATDVVHVCFASGLTGASYGVTVTAVSAGSCKITVSNFSNSATPSDTPVLNFVVIKGVNA